MALTKFIVDPTHSDISFYVRHMLVARVRGAFRRWSGTLLVDDDCLANGAAEAQIEVGSVDTGDAHRDDHLRGRDFFDAESHPTMLFRSTEIDAVDGSRCQLRGDLTLRGVTRAVVLDVEFGGRMRDPAAGDRVGFAARACISRKAFGMTFNQILDSGGLALGDKVEIVIDVEAVASPVVVIADPTEPPDAMMRQMLDARAAAKR
ncbi:MAG TPA: YceI family protein [Polyangia bacterium]|jgi:polyisoprenoid-binding protein YceI|nr:YceI family protein [Polyangia bacterium]HWE27357.1 YceI family protein [Polyangia bacterium]